VRSWAAARITLSPVFPGMTPAELVQEFTGPVASFRDGIKEFFTRNACFPRHPPGAECSKRSTRARARVWWTRDGDPLVTLPRTAKGLWSGGQMSRPPLQPPRPWADPFLSPIR